MRTVYVRIYPPVGLSEPQIEELEGKGAKRCVDILVGTGVIVCAPVYEPEQERGVNGRPLKSPQPC
jgi:hypothetical protein